jgi:hypothetical protein
MTPATTTSQLQTQINEATVCLDLTITAPGVRRKLDVKRLNEQADREMLHASKNIIESPAMSPIWNRDAALRAWIKSRAVPVSMLRNGLYLIPLALMEQVDQAIESYRIERQTLIDAFFVRYPALIERARETYEALGLFDERDYPAASELRQAFLITVRYLTFNVPKALEEINTRIFERERQRAETEWSRAIDEIRNALRENFAGLVTQMVARLGETKNGGRKALRDDALADLTDFISVFEARNLTNDADLQVLINQARQTMRGLEVDQLRGKNSETMRDSVRASFETLNDKLNVLVKPAGRKLQFDQADDEAPQ